MIYYRKKHFIKIAELWYNYDEVRHHAVDILRFKFVTKKVKAASLEKLYTLLLDLEKNENELFNAIKKNTRYEIKRAKDKDNIECKTFLDTNEKDMNKLHQYIDFFNDFADSKGRSHITFSELSQFYNEGTLCIRYAFINNDILTMHAYIVSDNTARLYQSSSLFRKSDDINYRNLIARANRLLHWEDILYFKNKGILIYDLGGWYGGNTLTEQLSINIFKESFGGQKKEEYSFILPVTLKGRIAVALHSIIRIFKKY
jgi:lipid II:glycine glycyltransferase (peptidoglycan interpeptide bridge formation enzyme)